MTSTRSFAAFGTVFAVVYAVAYVVAVENNYALFTYHPALEEFGFLVERPKDGPAMYWYGWMATAGIIAFAAAAVASLIPERAAEGLWSGLAWAVPVAMMVVFSYLLSGFFMR
jgi:phosphoglycerol transferase MdoB-like AlkP superfamily enzyme